MDAQTLAAVSDLLKEHGFEKKGLTWRLDARECVLVFNLQRSNFGDSYYANSGALIKTRRSKPNPRFNECHIYGRMEELLKRGRTRFQELLNFEADNVPAEKRRKEILVALRKALPVFLTWQTVDGLKTWIRGQKQLNWAITGAAVKLLEE